MTLPRPLDNFCKKIVVEKDARGLEECQWHSFSGRARKRTTENYRQQPHLGPWKGDRANSFQARTRSSLGVVSTDSKRGTPCAYAYANGVIFILKNI